jgi:Tfp pilus assembly protein FimT
MRDRGVVLIDVVMMLAVLGIVLLAVMPSAHPGESMKLVAATTILASDLEFAQSATLARPADPTIVRFDPEGTRYWLALASEPDTPILRPDGVEPYEVEFGVGAHRDLWGINLEIQGIDDQTLTFDPMGRLVSSSNGVIRFGNDTGELAVVVRATTGSVSVLDGSAVPAGDGLEPQDEPGLGEGEAGDGSGGGLLPPPPPPENPPPKTGATGIGILGL